MQRQQIDKIDQQLLALFAQRMDIAAEIARIKVDKGLPILDRTREQDKLQAVAKQVRPELVPYACTLYDTLFELSRRYQQAGQE